MTSKETDWDIHSCGYHCEIPACMKAQRLELLARLDAAEKMVLTAKEIVRSELDSNGQAEAICLAIDAATKEIS